MATITPSQAVSMTTHSLPSLFTATTTDAPVLVTQGAEALIYRTSYLTPSTQIALKYRPKKSYRHPTLDARLTRARLLAEARVLVRCRREGVPVPAVLGADWDTGWLATEWIDGSTVKDALRGLGEGEGSEGLIKGLMGRIGQAIGRLHAVGVCHGDLTTSNLMLGRPNGISGEGNATSMIAEETLRPPQDAIQRLRQEPSPSASANLAGDVIIIDFGLAVQTVQDEDRAVDLYVLERAFGSTHPQAEGFFGDVLEEYGQSYKGAKTVLRRLEEVRLRGRKKSMVG